MISQRWLGRRITLILNDGLLLENLNFLSSQSITVLKNLHTAFLAMLLLLVDVSIECQNTVGQVGENSLIVKLPFYGIRI